MVFIIQQVIIMAYFPRLGFNWEVLYAGGDGSGKYE